MATSRFNLADADRAASSAEDEAAPRAVAPPVRPALRWAILGLLLLIFATDYRQTEDVEIGILFNLCIGLTLWTRQPLWTASITVGSVLLRVIAHNHNEPTSATISSLNLGMDLLVQIAIGGLIWRQMWAQQKLELGEKKARTVWLERRRVEVALSEELKASLQKERDARATAQAALEDAHRATRQASESAQKERQARAAQRETFNALERVKALSLALHQAVLPENVPSLIAEGTISLAARYAAAESQMEIGGDFYDVLMLDDTETRYGIVIGDVAGHGVEAAAQTALVTTTLRAFASENSDSPADVMARTARTLDGQMASFVSLVYGVYDARTGILTYANAGHEPPILVRAGAPPIALNPTGTLLGVGMNDFEQASVPLRPGDALILLTDGLTETRTLTRQMLGWDGAAALCARHAAHAKDSDTLADLILKDARTFATDGKFTDDVALLVLRVQAK